MDLQQFSDWLSATRPSLAIQTTSWAIPGIQTVHILALALVATSALLLALRIVGVGLTVEDLSQVAKRSTRVIWWLLLILLLTGALLITAEPYRTITNPVFYAKMIMLALVSGITLWLAGVARRNPARTSVSLRIGAIVSLLLWIGIIFAGRFIAYYEPG